MPRPAITAAIVAALLTVLVVTLVVVLRRPTPPPQTSPAPSSGPEATPAPPAGSPGPGTVLAPCPPPSPAGALTLSVLTFNIHGAVDKRNRYDLRRVAEEIAAWDVDVVLVQEIHRFRPLSGFDQQPTELAERLGMEVAFGQNFSRRAKVEGYPRRRTGTAILSRYPILDHRNTPLPNRAGLEQRGLLRATLDVGGREVDVYGTHLQPGGVGIRSEQVAAIRQVIETRDPGGRRPFLLGGDFNSEPDSPPMRLATAFATDPWPQVGVGVGETVRPRQPRARVDYVLLGPRWRAVRARTLLSQVSDHRAVRVQVELSPPC